MGRCAAYAPLRVFLNNRQVATLTRASSSATSFAYDKEWLGWDNALSVSLSLPLRETPYRGAPVSTVFENLLPDSDKLRRLVAERVGARGINAYNLLSEIGHDCVGALQFIADDDELIDSTGELRGDPVESIAIEHILNGLSQTIVGQSGRIDVYPARRRSEPLGLYEPLQGRRTRSRLISAQRSRLPASSLVVPA